jgi:hypothetical protein
MAISTAWREFLLAVLRLQQPRIGLTLLASMICRWCATSQMCVPIDPVVMARGCVDRTFSVLG